MRGRERFAMNTLKGFENCCKIVKFNGKCYYNKVKGDKKWLIWP